MEIFDSLYYLERKLQNLEVFYQKEKESLLKKIEENKRLEKEHIILHEKDTFLNSDDYFEYISIEDSSNNEDEWIEFSFTHGIYEVHIKSNISKDSQGNRSLKNDEQILYITIYGYNGEAKDFYFKTENEEIKIMMDYSGGVISNIRYLSVDEIEKLY